jgi:uncharacterized protein (DUF2147 family)
LKRPLILLVLIGALASTVGAEDPVYPPDAVRGTWETARDGKGWSVVEIYERDGRIHGRITWISEDVYGEDDERGMAGLPVVDRNNPDPALRTRPLVGIDLMRDFEHDGGDKWRSGRIYDPTSGKDYRCKLTLKDPDTLEIFGYVKVGFVKLGRNTTWTRRLSTTLPEP